MKKLIALILSVLILTNPLYAAWDSSKPAGTSNASDIDTWVGANNTALQSLSTGINFTKGLYVNTTGVTAVRIQATTAVLQTADLAVTASSVDVTCAITSSGANGLDTGSESSSSWYYGYIIQKSSDSTKGCLLSLSATAPTMPSGYDQKLLVTAVRNNSSSDFLLFRQCGSHYIYDDYQSILSTTSPSSSFTDIDCSAVIPPITQFGVFNAKKLTNNGSSANTTFYFRPNGSSATGTIIFSMEDGHGNGGQGFGAYFNLITDTSQIIEYKSETQQLGIQIGVVGFDLY